MVRMLMLSNFNHNGIATLIATVAFAEIHYTLTQSCPNADFVGWLISACFEGFNAVFQYFKFVTAATDLNCVS